MNALRYLFVMALVLIVIALIVAGPASAEVIPRTGDYRVVQTDAGDDGYSGPKLTRYYHSAWQQRGIFGPGWMTDYDITVERGENDTLKLLNACTGEKVSFVKGLVNGADQSYDSSDEAVYSSNRCGCQSITATPDGYVRTCLGRTENFDSAGRLTKVQHSLTYAVDVIRNSSGQITALADGPSAATG